MKSSNCDQDYLIVFSSRYLNILNTMDIHKQNNLLMILNGYWNAYFVMELTDPSKAFPTLNFTEKMRLLK